MGERAEAPTQHYVGALRAVPLGGRARNDRNYVKLRLTNPFYDAQDAFIMDVCNSVSRRWSENAAKRHAFYAFRNLPEAVNPLEAA